MFVFCCHRILEVKIIIFMGYCRIAQRENHSITHKQQYLLTSKLVVQSGDDLMVVIYFLIGSEVCSVETSCRMGSNWSTRLTSSAVQCRGSKSGQLRVMVYRWMLSWA